MNQDVETLIDKAVYRALSELWEPKSKHKTHIAIGKKMDQLLKKLEKKNT